MVTWDGLTTTSTMPILGFVLLMDDGLGDDD